MTEVTREDILKIKCINDIVGFFEGIGFSEYKITENEVVVKVSEEKDFLKIILIDSLSDIQKYHTYLKYPIEYLLLITKDFESFTFMKKGFTKLDTEKFSTFKFNKSNITRTTMKKLNSLSFNNTDTFERLFAVKEIVKQFFDQFQKEHKRFSEEIAGIPDDGTRDWYASIIINRLMFIYFLQKKKLLYNNAKKCYDDNYLTSMLEYMQVEGKDKFYTKFLRVLFFEGFTKRYEDRSQEAKHLLGDRIQYLNGGLFLKHKIEVSHPNIKINDAAFETLFRFFDEWSWYLDDRHFDDENQVSADEEINPDVLGYIFERYVNQRQMGAYYTKEDITGYISKNTIIPFIFDKVQKEHPEAFKGKKSGWCLLKDNPDAYFYDAMKKGLRDANGKPRPLPDNIAAGIKDVSKRTNWNKPAHENYALETEIWREVVARRSRYEEIRGKMEKGEIISINDMITYNLNINKFARDFLANINDPVVLRSFYNVIENITVLDSTCGSGAFLFAALNILGSLYEACLDRMQFFIKPNPELYNDFVKIQKSIEQNHNRRYFILKTIILNNLYGVDIMEEAVEICKLRMFLKLVANMDNIDEVKPLPDIDYNIRHGNTLVGYIGRDKIDKAINTMRIGEGKTGRMKLKKVLTKINQYQTVFLAEDEIDTIDNIERESKAVEQTFYEFRKVQTRSDTNPAKVATVKEILGKKLTMLRDRLDKYLASEYGVETDDIEAIEHWRKTHLSFHWFTEFYGIIKNGGFDVIIGNPPYIDLKDLTDYDVKEFTTIQTQNLYSLVLERCQGLISDKGRQGYIVPVSAVATEGYSALQSILIRRSLVFSSFDDRPAHLFSGLDKNTLSIILLSDYTPELRASSTRLCRWSAQERDNLFPLLQYHTTPTPKLKGCLPKIGSSIEALVWNKLFDKDPPLSSYYAKEPKFVVYYSRKVNAFLQVLDFVPEVRDGKGNIRPPSEFKELYFSSANQALAVYCCMNSSLFRWFIDVVSDGSHLNRREVDNFPFDLMRAYSEFPKFNTLANDLSKNLKLKSYLRTMRYKHDTLTVQCIVPKYSKSIIDEIDRVLAKHYGFTEDELDFIINYDIKYRMGQENEEE